MTRWARLTWQAADPGALAADLGRRLGVTPAGLGTPAGRGTPAGLRTPAGAFLLPLGTADLELVPWRREGPRDEPRAAGRLVFEPIEGGAPDAVVREPPVLVLAGIGWATVELGRAEAELEAWLEAASPEAAADDGIEPHLGARTRVRLADGLPGLVLVLCEPSTEGRLAALLARDGEGPGVLYLWPVAGLDRWLAGARARRVTVSRTRAGPFGRSVHVPGSAAAGPFVIVVERLLPSSGAPGAGTIAP